MTSSQEFFPDWVSAPGDTITDILQERGLSEADFARHLGQTLEEVRNLLRGHSTITIAIARQLEKILGASVAFWMSRDFQYRQDISRIHQTDRSWLSELPVGDMIKFGWLKSVPHPSDEVAACLRFFGVPSVQAWREAYTGLQQMAAFRTSPSLDSRPAAVAVWLRQGEIEAQRINCQTWDTKNFREALSNIRRLTRVKEPSCFLPELKKHCASSGVAVAIVRTPTGCPASGATRFLSPKKALLQLSFRYLSDDHFWFTFFHEAGHLLLHGENGLFLEGVGGSTASEREANEFAARVLIPSEFQSELFQLRVNIYEVSRFARRLGVSPGIVVGQLQHLGRIKHNQLNGLKRRYMWQD